MRAEKLRAMRWGQHMNCGDNLWCGAACGCILFRLRGAVQAADSFFPPTPCLLTTLFFFVVHRP